MPVKEFKLPDLGEGLPDGEIIRWTVKVGDTVKVNDIIAEVETVKAAVELPSPFAGVVTALLAQEGETVPVGKSIISIETAASDSDAASAPDSDSGELERPLVGYGAQEQAVVRRRRNGGESLLVEEPARSLETATVLAKPPIRKLAKDLGVDLGTVPGTGPQGTVTRDDIARVASYGTTGPENVPSGALSGQSSGQGEVRTPVRGIRKRTAAAMVASAFTAPHVSLLKTIDVTPTMELRQRVAARSEFAGLKISPLLFVARAVVLAAIRFPEVNASWASGGIGTEDEIVQHAQVNLGIAAATERGLIVPNIKGAESLSLRELAVQLAGLADAARSGKTTPGDLTGGTLTITNIGVFGMDAGTPILNPGESMILAFGTVERRPWVVDTGSDERIEPRWVTQLGISFDHRVIDGEQGARFLKHVADLLNDPGLALL